MEYLKMCLIVCPLIFLGSFVDSVAGGGGIITLPAYLLAGLPAHTAAGTNKLVATCGSVTASLKYFRTGNVMVRIALISALGSLLGGMAGSRLALFIPEETLELIMVIALPVVALFLTFKRDFGMDHKPRKLSKTMETGTAFAIGLVIGCYDGLIGPGTGTFLILCFCGILGLDLLISGGCAKVSNLASNVASAVVYLFNGKAMYSLLLPAAICSVAGGYFGSKFAIKGGSRRIRKVMFLVLGLLFAKMIYDYFF
ncbi:MAG: TSUP family transporter [Oscillospiraceae bacterium]|nr:TSUP family transporter [Oscillospiraceae bacterium]